MRMHKPPCERTNKTNARAHSCHNPHVNTTLNQVLHKLELDKYGPALATGFGVRFWKDVEKICSGPRAIKELADGAGMKLSEAKLLVRDTTRRGYEGGRGGGGGHGEKGELKSVTWHA